MSLYQIVNSDDTDLLHEHGQCLQELHESVKTLRSELSTLHFNTNQLMQQLQQEKNRRDFSLDRFKHDDKKMLFYTGFSSFRMFLACFNFSRMNLREAWSKAKIVTSGSVLFDHGSFVHGIEHRRLC